jgi:hypothetical protein
LNNGVEKEGEMKRVLLIITFVLLASVGRAGEVLKWVDEQGVVHYTDNGSSVPEKYRGQIERRDLPEGKETSLGTAGEAKAATGDPQDRHGRGQDYWARRTKEGKDQLDRAYKEYERVRLEYNDLVAQYNKARPRAQKRQYQKQIDSLQDELNRRRDDVDKARELLEKILPEEAERAGAPAEWVK